jgi:hypothetical protein
VPKDETALPARVPRRGCAPGACDRPLGPAGRPLRHDRTRWAQRLHAILAHEGWPCSCSELLTKKGRRWLSGLALDRHARRIVGAHVEMITATEEQMAEIDPSCVCSRGTTNGCSRCRRSTESVPCLPATCSPRSARLAASAAPGSSSVSPSWTRSCSNAGESRRRGKLSKQGSPHLRWALVQAAHAAPARRPRAGSPRSPASPTSTRHTTTAAAETGILAEDGTLRRYGAR